MRTARDASFWIRLIYAVCLVGAFYNHARIIVAYGFGWNYGGLPFFVCYFWTALTFIDPLAAILLMTKPILGLILTVAIIVFDVTINSWVGMTYGIDIASFIAQVLFLIFVISTAGIAWRAESGMPLSRRSRV